MEHEKSTEILTAWGVFNIASPVPLILFTSFWGLAILAGFGFRSESPVILFLCLLPAFIHPVSTIAAFLRAIRQRKHSKRDSIRCAVLTAIGAAENILVWMFVAYLGYVG